jgi:hypothetical protein
VAVSKIFSFLLFTVFAAVFAGIQRQVSRVEKGEFVMADGRRGEW